MNEFETEALKLAVRAYKRGEIPVGAVVVKDGKIISRGFNKREKKQIATKHAEIVAIEKACKKLKSWRLDGCEIYVTLEPCPMCAGAIANARISTLYFATEEKTSSDNLLEKILSSNRLNHHVNIKRCDGKIEAQKLLQDFFKKKRKKTQQN